MANMDAGNLTVNIHLARPENVKVTLDRIADMRVIVITNTFCDEVTEIKLFEDRMQPKSFDALIKNLAHQFSELAIPELEPMPEPTGGIVEAGKCPVTGDCEKCPFIMPCSESVSGD